MTLAGLEPSIIQSLEATTLTMKLTRTMTQIKNLQVLFINPTIRTPLD